ncbi:hypothetical protein H0N98_03140, partial [Candidatus Micrarchaeota archaeon]|nr:hypothetical protein [Candidatus Micrarchaeota archaeon]
MAGKSEVVAQKKNNQNLLWILQILFTLIFFVVVYCTWISFCTPWNLPLFVLAFIIFLFIAGWLKPPLLLNVLLVLVLLFSMLSLGGLCPPIPEQCVFPAGITCISSKLNTVGNLTLIIGQGTGHPIMVTGVNCTMNSSASWAADNQATLVYLPNTLNVPVNITS